MAIKAIDQQGRLNQRVSVLLYAVLLAGGDAGLSLAIAGPEGGQIVGGSGTISQSGSNTSINQNSQNMAIDWQRYNVSVDERVQYIQPNAAAISLNRILSQNGSTIAGRIDANGQVILVNPNGILFTPTSIVNVGGIIASGLDIQPTDFMNGHYIFDEVFGSDGTVINSGTINASLGGDEGGNVALIGKQVKNEGLITANLGTVSLAAGKQAVLTFDQGGLLGVRISQAMLQEELGVDPAVINSGEIQAEGGRVLLSASTSHDIFSQAVNSGGLESATSVVMHDDGSFTLGGGADVLNSGAIDTSTTDAYAMADETSVGRIFLIGENVTSSGELHANAVNGNGGEIELHAQDTALLIDDSVTSARSESGGEGGIVKVLGDKVGLFDHAIVEASGANGGGQVLIGGDQEGNNALIPNAEFIYLSENSKVSVDALDNGDGGRLITFASDTARIYGDLFARGGINGGDGGFIETSGLVGFQIVGTPDASAPRGEAGTWLIDPYNITVTNSNNNVSTDSPFIPSGENSTIRAIDITNALISGTDVIIRTGGDSGVGNGDITFAENGDVDYNNNGDSNMRMLTLDAVGDIIFEAGNRIFDSNSNSPNRLNIELKADGAVILEGASGGLTAASITTQGGAFTVGSESDPVASFTNDGTVDTSGAFNQDGGDITITTSGTLSSTGLNTNGGSTGTSNTDRVGRNGGNVTLNAAAVVISGAINTMGSAGRYRTDGDGDNGQNGGAGGAVTMTALSGDIAVNAVDTSGGVAAGDYTGFFDTGDGGDAGVITLNVAASSNINLNGDLTAAGARGYINGNSGSHGAGNHINLNGNVVLATDVVIDAAGATDTTVNIPGAYGNVTFAGTVVGTSDRAEDLTITGNAINFSGLVGNNIHLGNLQIDAAGVVDAATHTITANSVTVNQSNGFLSGDINTVSADGSDANGGAVSITADTSGAENIIMIGNINTRAGTRLNDGAGNAGGTVSLTGRDITVGSIDTAGGAASGATANNGGAAGTLQINANEGSGTATAPSITLNGDINATGGAGVSGGTNGVTQTADLTLTSTTTATVTVNYDTNNFTTAITLTGSAGTDTLNAANRENSWMLASTNSTLNNNFTFSNIEALMGNGQNDHFTLPDSGVFFGALNGRDGDNDTVEGGAQPNAWNITADGVGTVSSLNGTFNGIETLTGGADVDTFNIESDFTGTINGGLDTGDIATDDTSRDHFNFEAGIGNTFSGRVNGGKGDDTFAINSTGITFINTLNGDVGSGDTLVAANEANYWSVNSANGGALYSDSGRNTLRVGFSGVENLTGNDGIDDFIIGESGAISQIDGSGGSNRLTGANLSNIWDVSGPDAGSLAYTTTAFVPATINFDNIQNIIGGTMDDRFNLSVTDFNGLINGGDGSDSLNITVAGDRILELGNRTNANQNLYQIESVTAHAGSRNQLISDSAAAINSWNINDARGGNVSDGTTTTTFSNIDDVTGNSTIDNFILAVGNFFGLIDGGDGSDSLNITVAGDRTLELGNRRNANQNLYQIESVTAHAGSRNELISDSEASINSWNIDAARGGNVGDGTTTTTFSNIDDVTGNSTIDNFILAVGNFFGLIDGGDGSDSLNITVAGDRTLELGNRRNANQNLYQIESVTAHAGSSNELISDSAAAINSWNIVGARNGVVDDGTTTTTYSSIDQARGGSSTDNFTLSSASFNGLIDGGIGTDSLIITATGNQTIEVGNRPTSNLNVHQLETITANEVAASNELIGDFAATTTTWSINGSGSGTLADGANSIGFSNFTDLTGTAGTDNFTLSGSPTSGVSGVIDGMGGIDRLLITAAGNHVVELGDRTNANLNVHQIETITANNLTSNELISDANASINTWIVMTTNSGRVANNSHNAAFNNFATLTEAGTAAVFTVNSTGSVTTLNGNSGNDIFTLFGSAETINAGNGRDEVTVNIGGDVSTVNGNAGNDLFNIDGNLSAAVFNGGEGDDDFSVTGNVSNVTLNGEGGSDDFSVGAVTSLVVIGGEDTGNTDIDSLGSTVAGFELNLGDTALISGVTASQIEAVSAIDGILNARDDTTTTWNINAINGGNVSDTGDGSSAPENLVFRGFVELNGGDGVDLFNVSSNGSVTGNVSGGGGNDRLTITLDNTRTQPGQIKFDGGAGDNNEITLTGSTNNETYTPNVGLYDQLAYENDNGVTFDANYRAVGTVNDNVQATTLTINSSGTADLVSLSSDSYNTTSGGGAVSYAPGSKSNITLRALNGSDVAITGDITLGGNLTMTADEIDQEAISTITANGLILDNVTQAGTADDALSTNVTELSVMNHSGAIFIGEQNDIAIVKMTDSTGDINLTTANGSIDSSANLSSSGVLNLTAVENISLAGNNQLSGGLTLNGTTVNVINLVATQLASVTAEERLTITSVGDIIGTGAIVVSNGSATGLANLRSSTGSITLNNAGNNFDVVNIRAANDASLIESDAVTITNTAVGGALNVTSAGDMSVGDISAANINLRASNGAIIDSASDLSASSVTLAAANGIGGGTVSHVAGSEGFANLDTSGAINTRTATLSAINTTAGTVNIDNSGDVSVRDLRNRGDIILKNSGDIALQVTQHNGVSVGAIDANYGGDVSSSVYPGSVAILNDSASSVIGNGTGIVGADITAESLFVNGVTNFGVNGAPIRLRVNDQFTLIASRGVVQYVGGDPRNITTSADLIESDASRNLGGQQMVNIDSLASIDPAVFSEVRNYNYGDTALRLPSDQNTSGEADDEDDEDEDEEAAEEEV